MNTAFSAPAGIHLSDTRTAFAHRSGAELRRMEWMFRLMNHPAANALAVRLLLLSIRLGLPVKGLIRATIFQHFCGGETLEDCRKTIGKLARYRIGTILDYSVEGENSETGFSRAAAELEKSIRLAAGNPDIPFAVFKTSGIAPAALLEKAQAGHALSPAEDQTLNEARTRFAQICRTAAENQVRLFVDAEESWIQDIIDTWTYQEMERYNKSTAWIFNTYQLYRSDVLGNLHKAVAEARTKGYRIGAKLVRGAYMEKEAVYAERLGKASPIQISKAATDRDFNEAWSFCLNELDTVHFCSGSHNEESNQNLAQEMVRRGLAPGDTRIWFAQLFGMSDNISYGLASGGFNVAKYVPYGPVFSVMPYLVRRAAENTSVAGQTSRELSLIQEERKRRKSGTAV
jgi:proline dehydrogenase